MPWVTVSPLPQLYFQVHAIQNIYIKKKYFNKMPKKHSLNVVYVLKISYTSFKHSSAHWVLFLKIFTPLSPLKISKHKKPYLNFRYYQMYSLIIEIL